MIIRRNRNVHHIFYQRKGCKSAHVRREITAGNIVGAWTQDTSTRFISGRNPNKKSLQDLLNSKSYKLWWRQGARILDLTDANRTPSHTGRFLVTKYPVDLYQGVVFQGFPGVHRPVLLFLSSWEKTTCEYYSWGVALVNTLWATPHGMWTGCHRKCLHPVWQ